MNASYKERVLGICKTLSGKMDAAAIRLESNRARTIININADEHTVLVWALREFWDRVEKSSDKATQ